MSSREHRRIKSKMQKKASEQNVVEKKRTQHPLMWVFSVIVLVIIVLAFVVAPALGGRAQGSNRLIFGYYNGEAIEYTPDSYFARQRDAYAQQVENMSNANDENYQWQAMQVWKGAYDATVVHTAILQQADRSGLHISEQKLDRTIAAEGPYRKNGKFSAELYRQTPNSERINTRNLFEENILHEQWTRDLMNIPSAPGESEFFAGLATPERRFEYVSYSLGEYPKEKVLEYAQDNMARFSRANLSRISLRMDEGEAKEIYSQLQENPSRFEELAQNHSSDENAEKGGDMGWTRYHELSTALEDSGKADTIFSLSDGEISELIETSFGYAIYRCDEPAQLPDFTKEEEIAAVRSYLIQNERGLVEDYFIEQAQTLRTEAEAEGLSVAASRQNLETARSNYFPINYGGSFFLKSIQSENGDGILKQAQSNSRVLTALFSLAEDEYSEAFVLGRNVVVARLLDERETPEEELDQIKNYYSYITRNFQSQDIRQHFLQSDKLEDNFMRVFSKVFLQ